MLLIKIVYMAIRNGVISVRRRGAVPQRCPGERKITTSHSSRFNVHSWVILLPIIYQSFLTGVMDFTWNNDGLLLLWLLARPTLVQSLGIN